MPDKTKTIMERFDFAPISKCILDHMASVNDAHNRYLAAVDQAKIYNTDVQQHKEEEAARGLKAALAERINTFRLMEMKPSRRDLQTMCRIAAGNHLAVRAVAELAKGSGYKVKYVTPEQLESDLADLRTLCRDCEDFAPRAGVQIAAKVTEKPAWAVQASSGVALDASDKIKAIEERWREISTPYVVQWSDAQEQVERETYKAKQAAVSPDYEAQAIAFQAAQGEENYSKIMAHYIKGGAGE